MEPVVVIAILWLLGRGKKAETPADTAARGISPSVTPPLTTQTATMTPTFTDAGGTGEIQGEFGSRSRGVSVVGRRGGSGVVDKSAIGRPPSAPPSPVYRPPEPPRAAPAPLPPTNPAQIGPPPPQEPKRVAPIQRESPSLRDTIASGGVPDFCSKEYRPFLLSPCAEGTYEPALRPGPPPAGTLVVTGTLPGAQRSIANPSCPNALGQGGVWYMTAGSPEWNAICPPTATAPEI